METRMDRHRNSRQEPKPRSQQNEELYGSIYTRDLLSSEKPLNNEKEIDLSNIKDLMIEREGYSRVKDLKDLLSSEKIEDKYDQKYYQDIDNKIYDINEMLKQARSQNEDLEREKYRKLMNTQYDILSKLDLNEQFETDEMDTTFFTREKLKNTDLLEELKGDEGTILTEAVKAEDCKKYLDSKESPENLFYTGYKNFSTEDFEEIQDLKNKVKKNNGLIKFLIVILILIFLVIIGLISYTVFLR
ncbi:MAG: hypothetical protein WC917_05080 [Bacilli bacterium]